jgi:hypothetical protein
MASCFAANFVADMAEIWLGVTVINSNAVCTEL